MSSFSLLQDSLQIDLSQISNQTTNLYKNKCNSSTAQCPQLSISQCQGKYEKECIWQYPKQNGCFSNGVYFSKTSGVRFPNNVDTNTMSNNDKLFVCASTALDKSFAQIKKKHLNKIVRSYIGTRKGFFRAFPGIQAENINGKCKKSYDPSARPWYIQATTGSKNVVIVIDASSLMTASIIKNMKSSLQTLIGTMSFNNFLGVVVMKSSSGVMLYQQLRRAIQQVKTALINGINSIVFQSSQTDIDYELAFQNVKHLFSRNVTDQYGSQCQYASNIVILMSASMPTKGLDTFQKLAQKIDGWNKNIKFKLFSYSFGSDRHFSLLKALSCNYQGSAFRIPAQDQDSILLKNIRHYQKQLSRGIIIDSPVCTAPYEDFNTKQRMITLSIPIYQYIGGTRYVLGAAGIDILMKVLQNNTISQTQVVKQLVKCVSSQPTILDPCYLQYLRPEDSKCGISNCSSIFNYIPYEENCSQIVRKNILKTSFDNQAIKVYECCGMTVANVTIIASLLSVFVFLVILFVIGFFLYRYYKGLKQNQQKKNLIDSQKKELDEIQESKGTNIKKQDIEVPQNKIQKRRKFLSDKTSNISQYKVSNRTSTEILRVNNEGGIIQSTENLNIGQMKDINGQSNNRPFSKHDIKEQNLPHNIQTPVHVSVDTTQ